MNVRILLADDHQIMREGLRALLEAHPSMQVVAEAENGIETLKIARQEKPDVVIMDIGMPDINGIEATRLLKAELADIKVIQAVPQP